MIVWKISSLFSKLWLSNSLTHNLNKRLSPKPSRASRTMKMNRNAYSASPDSKIALKSLITSTSDFER